MSSLWTPEGEHPVGREDSSASQSPRPGAEQTAGSATGASTGRAAPDASTVGGGPEDLSEEERREMAAHLEELQQQLVQTPAELVVANHAYGLFELAAIHLSQKPPRLEDARLAVDAMATLVEGLKGRLGENENSLIDALSQIRLAYVQISGTGSSAPGHA